MKNIIKLPKEKEIKKKLPLKNWEKKIIQKQIKEIKEILKRKSKKKLLIIWPCSLDFEDSILEYAKKLKKLADKVKDKILIIMRCYNAKPRTTVWWKGILYNWKFNSNWNIIDWIYFSRNLFLKIIKIWLPIANEMLYTDIIPYYDDLLSYVVIWARNSENQQHREVASWLKIPVWFKNPTSGDFDIATNNIIAASNSNQSLIQWKFWITNWNPYSHIVIRWQKNDWISKSHIFQTSINKIDKYLKNKKLKSMYIIDTNHDNSNQDWRKQNEIMKKIMKLKTNNITWYMTESYLFDWNQKISIKEIEKWKIIKHGLSLTDWCIWWRKTKSLIEELYSEL